ncbi:hypothetical protein Tco_0499718 [Tanacetum coccineum]
MFISYVRTHYKLLVFPSSLVVICSLHDVVVHRSYSPRRRGSLCLLLRPYAKFSFALGALLVALAFLLLLVSSIDGLVLIPTDTSRLRNSSFIVASPVNTSAFRWRWGCEGGAAMAADEDGGVGVGVAVMVMEMMEWWVSAAGGRKLARVGAGKSRKCGWPASGGVGRSEEGNGRGGEGMVKERCVSAMVWGSVDPVMGSFWSGRKVRRKTFSGDDGVVAGVPLNEEQTDICHVDVRCGGLWFGTPVRAVILCGPVWGCDRLVIRAKVIENQIMAASAIAISFDSSDESVGSPPSRVILFGDIPTVIPSTSVVAPETSTIAPVISSAAPMVETTLVASPTGLCGLVPYSGSDSDSPDEMSSPEHISLLPAISPFLCTDSSEAPDSSDGPPSQDPYVATIARWRSRVTIRPSSSSEFPIAPVTAPLGIRQRSAILIQPGEAIPFGRPYRTHLNGPRKLLTARKRAEPLLARRLASRHASPRSSDYHSSSSSSSSNSLPVHSLGLDASD